MEASAVRPSAPPDKLTVAVVGGGAWGTALATVAARAGHDTLLWVREPEVVETVRRDRVNERFLPGIALPETLRVTGDLADCAPAHAVLLVVPAQYLANLAEPLARHMADGPLGGAVPAAICAKGIERASRRLLSDVLADAWPAAVPAVLSGPSFAADVAKGLPTAVTLAAQDDVAAETLIQAVNAPGFRPYRSDDVAGAQVGGALKNVFAIACGIVEGRNLGDSARAALTARGFAEMTRFGVALGGRAETLSGLSGLGDLILTCGSTQSRNMSLGQALGRGESLDDILSGRHSVAEGVHTAGAVAAIARERGIDMPITFAVEEIVAGRTDVDGAIESLLSRPLTSE